MQLSSLLSSYSIWLFNLIAKHVSPTVMSCSDLCSWLLLRKHILEVQNSITKKVFSTSLHIKNAPFLWMFRGEYLVSEASFFLPKRILCFCPNYSTANFCIQTEGVDYWPTYSFFRWDKTLLGSPQTPGTRSAAGWHPAHPSPASQRLELTSVCHDTLLQFDCVLALHVTSVSVIPSA